MAAEWRRVVSTLLLGQLLSLLITGAGAPLGRALSWRSRPVRATGTGVTSTFLAEEAGVSLPGTQSLLAYVLLALVYPAVHVARTPAAARWALPSRAWLRRVGWQYAVVALLDVEANYLVVLAYRYTSLTSVMLLDCFAIPVVMVLSRWRFGTRYSGVQLAGVALSGIGVVLLVTADVLNGRNNPNSTPQTACTCTRARVDACVSVRVRAVYACVCVGTDMRTRAVPDQRGGGLSAQPCLGRRAVPAGGGAVWRV
jgi:drug/metabolite transporter (DMT)-like permease